MSSIPPYEEVESTHAETSHHESFSSDSGLKFPDTIEIYRALFPHYLISSPAKTVPTASNAISHIHVTLHTETKGSGLTSKSSIKLHASTDEKSLVLGEVAITFSDATDLIVYKHPELGSGSKSEATHVRFNHSIAGDDELPSFEFARDAGGTVEKFEWVPSEGIQEKALATSNISGENFAQSDRGFRLQSTTTNTAFAIYVPARAHPKLNPRRLSAKLRLLPTADGSVGAKLLVVLSVLSLIERGKQSGNRKSHVGLKGAEGLSMVTAWGVNTLFNVLR